MIGRFYLAATAATLATAVACSSVASDAEELDAENDSSSDEGATANASSTALGTDPTTDEGGVADESTASGTTADEPPPGPSAGFDPCPDELPNEWLLCEDFERTEDLAKAYFEYQAGDDAFVRVQGDAASGEWAVRTRYREGVEGAGWLSAAIGRNPAVWDGVANTAPDRDFESIYWRVRIKTQAGWPDIGFGHLSSASVFANAEWTQAMVARLRSDEGGVVMMGDAVTCIEDSTVSCAGYDDATAQKRIDGLVGATPIFSMAAADQWHCVEAHVALNTPGAVDGVFEFWIDGKLENAAYDLDWRGAWTEFGINMVTLENLWPKGAPADLERAIDDFVISTAPIGC